MKDITVEFLRQHSQAEVESKLDADADALAHVYRIAEAAEVSPDVLAELLSLGSMYESALQIIRTLGVEGAADALEAKKRMVN